MDVQWEVADARQQIPCPSHEQELHPSALPRDYNAELQAFQITLIRNSTGSPMRDL